AAHPGHHHVEQDEVGVLAVEGGERVGARRRGARAVALGAEQVGEQLDVERDIVDDEDLGGVHARVLAAHAITSSARASSDGGTTTPIARAVFWLTIKRNFAGRSIGTSPTRSPRRILSILAAPRRTRSSVSMP